MEDSSQVQFMTSLVKSIQAVCHGHVEFLAKVEVRGHLVVSVDSAEEFDYILNEKVCRNPRESSLKFVSKSFHAEVPKKPKPTSDAACGTEDTFRDSPSPDVPHAFGAPVSDVSLMQQEEQTVEPEPLSPKSSPRPPSPCLHSSSHTSGAEKRLPVSEALPPLHSVTFSEVADRNFSHSFSIPPLQEHGHTSTTLQEGVGAPRHGPLPSHQLPSLHSRPSNPKRPRTLSHPQTETSSSSSSSSALVGDGSALESQTLRRESKETSEPSHRKLPQRNRGSERDDHLPVDIDLTLVKQEIEEAAQGLCLDASDGASFHQSQPAASSAGLSDLYQWNLPVHFQQANGADVGGGSSSSNVPSFHNPSLLSEAGRPLGDPPLDSSIYPMVLHGGPRASMSQEDAQARQGMLGPGPSLGTPPGMAGPSQGFLRGPSGEGGSGVRPGKVPLDIAQANTMVELTPGSGVYLYPHMLHRARYRQSGTSCANYLLKCFYTTTELLGSNLTGVNNKKLLDPQIIASIIDFTTSYFLATTVVEIKRALRARITAAECYHYGKLRRVDHSEQSRQDPASIAQDHDFPCARPLPSS